MNAATRTRRNTQGQQFAKTMRSNLGIGTRTRRFRKGLDLHADILECVQHAVFDAGWYSSEREELFRAAFGAWRSYNKHIAGYRANANVTSHINALSPWQFCALIGDMIDAGITNVGQGERFFAEMARSIQSLAAPAEEGDAPGQTEAAETMPKSQAAARIPTGSMSRTLRRTRRNTLHAATHTNRALGYRTLSGIIAAHVENGRLITVGTFLDRIGGADLPDGKRSWFGRFAKKAYRAANGGEPIRVWAQHRTTGRFVHVHVYGPIDAALYEATASYKGTQHLLAGTYSEAA